MRRVGPALLLVAYAGAFALAAFGGGLPAFDDHPGQFFRLWHALERTVPDGRWTADWNPDWWGGYPELQFYPPGFVVAGALIRLVGLWSISVEVVYQALCGVVLLLPALTTYVLLVAVLGDGWLALPPAFVALTLSAGLQSGVEESLRWGILTSRLSLGFLPLLALALRRWIETGQPPRWAPPAAAAVVLCHPANAPAAATLMILAAGLTLVLRPGRPTLLAAGAVASFTLALTAFWTLPFAVRHAWVVPLAWSHLGPWALLAQLGSRPLLVLIGIGALLAWVAILLRRRPFDAVLALFPIALLGVLLLDAPLFRRGWSAIEPDRLADGVVLAALWAAGLGVGALVAAATAKQARGRARPVAALALVALLALLPSPARSEPTLTLWPRERPARWPHLDEVSRAHDLDRLWAVLRGGTDRVLFLTSALRLAHDPAWYAAHSHVLGLAPLFAAREIVHGTFTHPAPLAARFYAGSPSRPRRIETLTEELDGQRVLGQPPERLSADAFEAFARRLRVATVVAPTGDAPRARFLDAHYTPAHTVAGFTVFERRDRPWPQLERITHRRYRLLVPPTGGVWVATGIAAYPLWQAKSGQGRLETRADAWGLLEVRMPLDVFEAELTYSEGLLEWSALAVTLLGGLAWAVWAGRRRRGPAPARGKPASALERRRRRR
ncbi:MAG TPA: hypothetical protein VGW35_16505 [Methylomirabilota bacterium]|nr:hypothetical protein [Methylomirabilota bacterium]